MVSRLIEEIGFGAYDMGSLHDSREQQPDAAVYNRSAGVEEQWYLRESIIEPNARGASEVRLVWLESLQSGSGN